MAELAQSLGGTLNRPLASVLGSGPVAGVGNALASILGAGGLDYAFFDSSLVDRSFQDILGVTAADEVGEAVGLGLSLAHQGRSTLSQVIAAQAELVPNGDFSSTTGWTVTSPGEGTQVAAGVGTIKTTTNTYTSINRAGMTVGKVYQIEWDVVAVRAGSMKLDGLGATVNPTYNTVGRKRHIGAATATSFGFARGSATTDIDIDNVSIKQIPAHYGLQDTGNFKPILQSTGWKFDGSDDNLLSDWLTQAGANIVMFQASIPAVVASTQVLAGANDATDTAGFRIGVGTDGKLRIKAGDQFPTGIGPDIRGTNAIFSLSTDGSTAKVFLNDAEVGSYAHGGSVVTSHPLRIGARNGNGTADVFFGGSIKRLAFGKVAPTLAQFQQIRQQWLAAA